MLSSTVNDKGDIDKVFDRFIKKLEGCIATNFQKQRVKKINNHIEDNLYEKMRCLKGKDDPESIAEMAKVVETIAEAANNNVKLIKHELSKMKTDESKLDARQVWKLKKKFCPRLLILPVL